jgi:hypothetical protein
MTVGFKAFVSILCPFPYAAAEKSPCDGRRPHFKQRVKSRSSRKRIDASHEHAGAIEGTPSGISPQRPICRLVSRIRSASSWDWR